MFASQVHDQLGSGTASAAGIFQPHSWSCPSQISSSCGKGLARPSDAGVQPAGSLIASRTGVFQYRVYEDDAVAPVTLERDVAFAEPDLPRLLAVRLKKDFDL